MSRTIIGLHDMCLIGLSEEAIQGGEFNCFDNIRYILVNFYNIFSVTIL